MWLILNQLLNKKSLNKKIKLKYGFNHRYHGSIKKAKKIIDDKTFGKILNIRGVYGKSKIVTFGKKMNGDLLEKKLEEVFC